MRPSVDNEIYRTLGDRWYEANDDPVALLRAESRLHAPWIAGEVRRLCARATRSVDILDLGCGAGFLANDLAVRDPGLSIVGVDAAPEALEVAARHDTTGRNRWQVADARELPFADGSFDVVCAMDFLEHVSPIEKVVAEVSRVLRHGGLFFFHTFDRTWQSKLVVIWAVETFVKNVPERLHVHDAFVRPAELVNTCASRGITVLDVRGSRPEVSLALLRLGLTGVVPPDLEFRFTPSTKVGYAGFGVRA